MFNRQFRRQQGRLQNGSGPRWHHGASAHGRMADRRRVRPSMEALEGRVVLSSIYPVTKTIDDGSMNTLRWAILEADTNPGSTVQFQFPLGVYTFFLNTPLPAITADGTIVDGESLQNKGAIELSGAGLASAADGLDIVANHCVVQGLSIVDFGDAGIRVTGSNDTIQDDTLGTDYNQATGIGNGTGVLLDGSSNCVVQTSHLSGNANSGAVLEMDSGDTVDENQIGWVFEASPHSVPNGGQGVYVEQGSGDNIMDNSIYYNKQNGVLVSQSTGIVIGTEFNSSTGGLIFNNGGDGIQVVGGTASNGQPFNTDIFFNSIAGNAGNGINLIGSPDNYIGINQIGSQPALPGIGPLLPNGHDGILIGPAANGVGTASTNNSLGTYYEADVTRHYEPLNTGPNVIAGNRQNGVELTGSGTSNNSVVDNFIGTDTGKTAHANGGDGISISARAHNNTIGGTGLFLNGDWSNGSDGNVIAGNSGNGISLGGLGTTENLIEGNLIGGTASGTDSLPNGQAGVVVHGGASRNTIGGTGGVAVKTGDGNLISGNVGDGILINGRGTMDNIAWGNWIGTTYTGTVFLNNSGNGAEIAGGASFNSIGAEGLGIGPMQGGNLISSNTQFGVYVHDSGTSANQVMNNYIGTDVTGASALGNLEAGVLIGAGADHTEVGLARGVNENVISGNGGEGVGISDTGTTANSVQGNLIGTSAAGTAALGNQFSGVEIMNSATGNTIGGIPAASNLPVGNVISANQADGVLIVGPAIGTGTTGNVVEGNNIGTDLAGMVALPNKGRGVAVGVSASGNTIGGSASGAGNLISGNGIAGVWIYTSNNTLQDNEIGTKASGAAALGNSGPGVVINGSNNLVAGNLISGNNGDGLLLNGSDNVVQGNYIGTDRTGTIAVGNTGHGLNISINTGPGGNTVGGTAPGSANLISANGGDGMLITGPASSNNLIEGNEIGTVAGGGQALGNVLNGIIVYNTSGFTIGGAGGVGPGLPGNLISGNGSGVVLNGPGNSLVGNWIGIDSTGNGSLGNRRNGVVIGTTGNTVGGSTTGAGNVISGNGSNGVLITGTNASGNVLLGNLIGTNATGTSGLGNHLVGVRIQGAGGNTLGGIAAGDTNVISANSGSGVVLSGAGSTQNLVIGNDIGTNNQGQGASSLANSGDGVDIANGAHGNTIGGAGGVGVGLPGNLISNNAGDGVNITGGGTNGNQVAGNLIGTDLSGQNRLGNGGHGVFLSNGAQQNTIGGGALALRNVIAFNGKAGVAVGSSAADSTTLYNEILFNSRFSNTGIGIDLGDDGVTPNSPGGPHTGPNQLQNTPVITSAVATGPGNTDITVSLNSTPNGLFIIQLFISLPDQSGFGQGQTVIDTFSLSTDGAGNGSVSVSVPRDLAGQFVTATATDSSGDTSEFSQNVLVSGS
jgi:hypothetical protein